jgi:pyruvate/2-oxoglutarate dehydrogenase complex dihydrolipoamide acyltransferase (E2) component
MKKVILPELGEGIEEATISFWHFSKGDRINKGDDLVELTTDKATFNVPAPTSGVIKKILSSEGATVKVGDVLAELK